MPQVPPGQLIVEPIAPRAVARLPEGGWLLDFGRVWFGQLELAFSVMPTGPVTVRLGEKLTADGRVDMQPPGSVRAEQLTLTPTGRSVRPTMPSPPGGHMGKRRLAMPDDVGEVMPFRWVEVIGDAALDPDRCRQLAVHMPFDDDAATFTCDSPLLNDIWQLCKHTIKATSFNGLFVDGDRERYPREGDSYVNQLGWCCTTTDATLPRQTLAFMLEHPSHWVEYLQLCPIMAWEDYLHTGDAALLEQYYDNLAVKSLTALERDDGLIVTDQSPLSEAFARQLHRWEGPHVLSDHLKPLIDWPRGGKWADQSDGYEIVPVNTVCNAFHQGTLKAMADIARVLGREAEAADYQARRQRHRQAFNETFFSPGDKAYRDGEGSDHCALHASVAALRFGLAQGAQRDAALAFIKQRGMACSVYFAQYLLEALFMHDEADSALALLTSDGPQSWAHMLELGATLTLEAWDPSLKANADWNHAWGAAPANILPRWVAGVTPTAPGWQAMAIAPQPGPLRRLKARVPTPRGAVTVELDQQRVVLTLPPDVTVGLVLPHPWRDAGQLQVNGHTLANRGEGCLRIDPDGVPTWAATG